MSGKVMGKNPDTPFADQERDEDALAVECAGSIDRCAAEVDWHGE
jgi:hypothetical protein